MDDWELCFPFNRSLLWLLLVVSVASPFKADAWRAVSAVNPCGTSLGERFGSAVGVRPQCAHVLVSLAAAGAVLLMVPSNPMQAQHVSDAPGVVQDTVTANYSPVGPQPA